MSQQTNKEKGELKAQPVWKVWKGQHINQKRTLKTRIYQQKNHEKGSESYEKNGISSKPKTAISEFSDFLNGKPTNMTNR